MYTNFVPDIDLCSRRYHGRPFLHAASVVLKQSAKWHALHSWASSVGGSMRIQLAVLPFLALSVAAVSMDQGNGRMFNDAVSTDNPYI